ncbi:MAG: hypothetical protein ACYC0I_02375 [Acidimicrobiales bacterium]
MTAQNVEHDLRRTHGVVALIVMNAPTRAVTHAPAPVETLGAHARTRVEMTVPAPAETLETVVTAADRAPTRAVTHAPAPVETLGAHARTRVEMIGPVTLEEVRLEASVQNRAIDTKIVDRVWPHAVLVPVRASDRATLARTLAPRVR